MFVWVIGWTFEIVRFDYYYHRWVDKSPTNTTYMANSYEYKTFNVKFQLKKKMDPKVDEGEIELHDRIKEHSSEGWRLISVIPITSGWGHTSHLLVTMERQG